MREGGSRWVCMAEVTPFIRILDKHCLEPNVEGGRGEGEGGAISRKLIKEEERGWRREPGRM